METRMLHSLLTSDAECAANRSAFLVSSVSACITKLFAVLQIMTVIKFIFYDNAKYAAINNARVINAKLSLVCNTETFKKENIKKNEKRGIKVTTFARISWNV